MTAPRAAARTFQDLVVWRKAHELVLAVYSFTAAFPKQETYGLTLQMRRAAVSVPANIAEGFRRRGKEIGRAAGRGRGEISVGAGSFKKKKRSSIVVRQYVDHLV